MSHFNIHASTDGVTKIEIFGQIGDSFFEEGNTLESVRAELDGVENDKLEVDIASLGGDAFEGLAIHDLFAAHKGEVTINMVGATASAGAVIAESGDKINISENTLFLIHNSHGIAIGTAEEIKKTVDAMEKIDTRMTSIFTGRAESKGKSEADIKSLMKEDKFIDADEAIEFGFADKKIETSKIAASIDIDKVMASDKLSDAQKVQIKATIKTKKMDTPKENKVLAEMKTAMTDLKTFISSLGKVDPKTDPKTDPVTEPTLDNAELQAKLTSFGNTLNILAEANVQLEADALKAKTDMDTITTEKTSMETEKAVSTAKEVALMAEVELLKASKTNVPASEDKDPEDKESLEGSWGRMVLAIALKNAR